MADITLDAIIRELEKRIPRLKYINGIIPSYEYDDMETYEEWLARTKRYLNIHFHNDRFVKEFEETSKKRMWPDQQQKLLAILKAFADLPTLIPQKDNTKDKVTEKGINFTANFSNTNNQSQNQEQTLAVNMFLEAIKDDLTGKQVKELKGVIAESAGDKEKARSGIVEKLKSFGSDVASNIVANIITNPSIWQSFI